ILVDLLILNGVLILRGIHHKASGFGVESTNAAVDGSPEISGVVVDHLHNRVGGIARHGRDILTYFARFPIDPLKPVMESTAEEIALLVFKNGEYFVAHA